MQKFTSKASPMNDLKNHIPLSLIDRIGCIIDTEAKSITNRDLQEFCNAEGINGFSIDPHLCHEIAETALNFRKDKVRKRVTSSNPSAACSEIPNLAKLADPIVAASQVALSSSPRLDCIPCGVSFES